MPDHDSPTHLDLFSGIGGFALAARWAGYNTIAFCEKDPYCQRVLRKHWPTVPIHNDILQLNGRQFDGVQLLTGGFPCQPYSNAGQQRGSSDDRALWPQMLRIIKEAKPRYIVGENVAGFIRMELDQSLADLESQGYTTQTLVLPACALDAPHRRDRIWLLAALPNPDSKRGCSRDAAGQDAENAWQPPCNSRAGEWPLEPDLCRVAHGIPHRVDRLRGLGNAILAQLAYQILTAIPTPTPRLS